MKKLIAIAALMVVCGTGVMRAQNIVADGSVVVPIHTVVTASLIFGDLERLANINLHPCDNGAVVLTVQGDAGASVRAELPPMGKVTLEGQALAAGSSFDVNLGNGRYSSVLNNCGAATAYASHGPAILSSDALGNGVNNNYLGEGQFNFGATGNVPGDAKRGPYKGNFTIKVVYN